MFQGPYEVVSQKGPFVTIRCPSSGLLVVHLNHCKSVPHTIIVVLQLVNASFDKIERADNAIHEDDIPAPVAGRSTRNKLSNFGGDFVLY